MTLSRVVAADGTRIAVRTIDGSGGDPTPDLPPVLLVHGLGSNAEWNWQRTGWTRALAERHLVLVDLRGHGHSDGPHDWTRYSLTTLVDDLRAVLDERLPGRRLDAVGYSLGARVLLELTAALPSGRVRRLVLGGMADQALLQRVDVDALELAVSRPPAACHDDRTTQRILATIGALEDNDVVALAELVRGLHSDPATARTAPTPTVPTLVAVGTADPIHDRAREWAAGLPLGSFLSIEGRHHISAVPAAAFRTAGAAFLAADSDRSIG